MGGNSQTPHKAHHITSLHKHKPYTLVPSLLAKPHRPNSFHHLPTGQQQSMSSSFTRLFSTTAVTVTKPNSSTKGIKDMVNNLFKERNLNRLAENFIKSSEWERFRSKHRIYQVTVRRLASAKRFSKIEEILELHKKYPEIRTEGFAMRIINLYGRAGMFDHAIKMFDEMPQLECERTVKSMNALLYACVESKNYDKVEKLFQELPLSLKVKPDEYSYNIMITAYCEMGTLDSALSMFDEMERKWLKPSLVTFNTILNPLFDDKTSFADAEKIWEKMEKKGVVPDIRTYNAKLRGLVNVGKMADAVKLVEELKNGEKVKPVEKLKKGKDEEELEEEELEKEVLKPDVFSFTALMKGYCNDGKLEEAKRVYEEDIVKGDILPVRSTIEIFVPHLCEKGEFDLAFKAVKDSVKRNCYVDAGMLQAVIDGLVKESKADNAKELAELAWTKSYSPKNVKLPESE